jgi:TM2 domain-containing membrane protein YozV
MYKIIGADGQPYGPITAEQLRKWIAENRANAQTPIQPEGAADWKPLGTVAEFAADCQSPPPPVLGSSAQFLAPPPASRPAPDPALAARAANKIAAGICGILLGSLGIHKFILGYSGAGLIMLLVTLLTCFLAAPIMSIIGLIEGIIYLTKTDEEFVRLYVAGRKEWF